MPIFYSFWKPVITQKFGSLFCHNVKGITFVYILSFHWLVCFLAIIPPIIYPIVLPLFCHNTDYYLATISFDSYCANIYKGTGLKDERLLFPLKYWSSHRDFFLILNFKNNKKKKKKKKIGQMQLLFEGSIKEFSYPKLE